MVKLWEKKGKTNNQGELRREAVEGLGDKDRKEKTRF